MFLLRHQYVITFLLESDTQSAEAVRDYTKVLV